MKYIRKTTNHDKQHQSQMKGNPYPTRKDAFKGNPATAKEEDRVMPVSDFPFEVSTGFPGATVIPVKSMEATLASPSAVELAWVLTSTSWSV